MKVFLVSKTNPKDRKEISQIEALKMSMNNSIPATHEIQMLSETGSDLKEFKEEFSDLQRADLENKRARISRNSDGQYFFRYLTEQEIHNSLGEKRLDSDREKRKRGYIKQSIMDHKREIIAQVMRTIQDEGYTEQELLDQILNVTFVIK